MCINLKNQHTYWSSYLAAQTYPMRPFMLLLELHFLQVALLTPLGGWLSYAYLTSYPHPCYIPWSSQVHLVLVGIILLVCSIMELGSLTLVPRRNLESPVCCSHVAVLLGARRYRETWSWIHHETTPMCCPNWCKISQDSLVTNISPCMSWSHPRHLFKSLLHCTCQ